jgi:hypothetical protein
MSETILRALDALEAGDQDELVATLLGALEDGPAVRRCVCPDCGQPFEWPGRLDHHQAVAHPADDYLAVPPPWLHTEEAKAA